MLLDDLRLPIVLAPLAGGPSTPALVAAVCEADAFGFLAGGYLTADRLGEQLRELRSLTGRPFGVNVFAPPPGPAEPAVYRPYAERIREWAHDRNLPVGEPRFSDDEYDAKMALLAEHPVPAVSFTFGMPDEGVVARLHDVGSDVWVTVTTPDEAAAARAGGADGLVVQGLEAGGHRGSFDDADPATGDPLLALLHLVGKDGPPLIAAGGIMSGEGIAAALAAGARAAQLGTAFLLCPEAGTSEPHRGALRAADAPTRFTRAFTGRAARGIVNSFMTDHDASAVSAYPEIHYVTQPIRQAARTAGDPSMINLWAGESYPQIRELAAGELVAVLGRELAASDA